MVKQMWMNTPPNVGEEWCVNKYHHVLANNNKYRLLYPCDVKKWHEKYEHFPEFGEMLGVRRVISVKPGRREGYYRIELSEDLYPDHP